MENKKNSKIINYIKNAALGFACLILYFVIPDIELELLSLFNVNYSEMPTIIKVIYLIIWEILTICIIIGILNKKIARDFNNIKKNHKEYYKKYFKFWLISVAVMMLSNLIINTIITDGIAANEQTLRDTFKISPLYVFFSSVIYAPLVEELVFRQSLKNIFPNKILFIIISGIIFGGLHVITGFSGPIDLLYLIPYCAPGFAFAYILADSDNIFIPISLHFMHNGILIALQFILLIFS
ncbi:MAG: CPBP family intramembrane metalloprotease [Lactobacillales bacterium]|nr:CPBP family intramembrane metalloprotease [Lactobacillales bacterium]